MNNKPDFNEFALCLDGVFDANMVLQMKNVRQHNINISCYEHCVYVAYISYIIAKRTGRDFRAAARGAMLHDLYLQNWDETNISLFQRLLVHPKMALENAECFNLNDTERDAIVNHMWPLTPVMPKTAEGKIVSLADKLCASAEMLGFPAPLFVASRLEKHARERVPAYI